MTYRQLFIQIIEKNAKETFVHNTEEERESFRQKCNKDIEIILYNLSDISINCLVICDDSNNNDYTNIVYVYALLRQNGVYDKIRMEFPITDVLVFYWRKFIACK